MPQNRVHAGELRYPRLVTTLRHIHRYMNDRRRVVLDDGREGKIVRVDTVFPENQTYVTVITDPAGDSVARVLLSQIMGPAEPTA